jgi:hypothetical protein
MLRRCAPQHDMAARPFGYNASPSQPLVRGKELAPSPPWEGGELETG